MWGDTFYLEQKKNPIWETPTLLTNAKSSTNTMKSPLFFLFFLKTFFGTFYALFSPFLVTFVYKNNNNKTWDGWKTWKIIKMEKKKTETVSSQATISDTTFNQNFFDLRKWVYCNGTDGQTYRHNNFMTKAQRDKLLRKKCYLTYYIYLTDPV